MIRWLSQTVVPVVTILVALVAIWYAAARRQRAFMQ